MSAERRGPRDGADPILYVLERYPELSQTFVEGEIRALRDSGTRVEVAAIRPGFTPAGSEPPAAAHVNYPRDNGIARRAIAAAGTTTASPREVGAYLAGEHAWPPPNGRGRLRGLARSAPWVPLARRARHIHAHFATEAADIARLLSHWSGTPYSFVVHAFDGFQDPGNLRRNLAGCAFCTTACEYNLRHLRAVAPEYVSRIEVLVVGADVRRFARTRPYDPDGPIVAVGRLVPQKGFDDLVDAVALAGPERLGGRETVIVGDGPERAALERRIARTGASVQLAGAAPPAEVRRLLEGAALSVLPCVVAPDGDRDSMPVVLKEAMALELPVLGTEEVGLPEMIGPDRGALVAPRDPAALADGLARLLALAPERRVAMGRAGRAWVEANADEREQGRRLLELIERGPGSAGAATAPVAAGAA